MCRITFPDVPADLYRFGINAEYILGAINGDSHVLSDFLCKTSRQLAPGIELPAANKVRQLFLAFIAQTIEQEILAVKAKRFGGYPECNDFEVGKLGNNTTAWYVSEFVHTICNECLADSKYSDKIRYEVAHKLSNSS